MLDELFAAYEVKLPVFEGPLDLLLHLIERNELNITAISLAQVTDQYIEYTRRLEQISAANLAEIIVSVGLAQNLAALRALATEGIQRGHMSLHARQVAIAAGATGEMVERVAQRMVEEGLVRIDRARELLEGPSAAAGPRSETKA